MRIQNPVFRIALLVSLCAAGMCRPARGQTKAAESTAAPVVFVYAPGFGIVGAVLGPSITVTCTAAGVCTIAAVLPTPAAAPTPVACEGYAVTAAETAFPLKYTPVASVPLKVHKNGLLLMNLGAADWTLSGSTVTLTAAQAAAAGDQVCFDYSH